MVENEKKTSCDLQVATIASRSMIDKIDEPQLLYVLITIESHLDKQSGDKRKDICFVVDRSTSMQGDHINMVKMNIEKAIQHMDERDQIAIVTFSDRAEVMMPMTQVGEARRGFPWSLLSTGGATEIFHGIRVGIDELRKADDMNSLRQLILLTDGRTYGDEQQCFDISRLAWENNIPISVMGIGVDWNDVFLDQLAAISGGKTEFITSATDLKAFLEKKIIAMTEIIFRGLVLDYQVSDGVELSYGFVFGRNPSRLYANNPIPLGDLHAHESMEIILELTISPQEDSLQPVDLFTAQLYPRLREQNQGSCPDPIRVSLMVTEDAILENPENKIISAVSRVMPYRLQEKARKEIKKQDVSEGTRHLQYLATHMLSRGEHALAHDILNQIRNLQKIARPDEAIEKRIKYGTRSLISNQIVNGGIR